MSNDQFDPVTTALVAIDLQNGIMGLPLAPYSGPEVLERTVELANALREKGGSVVWVNVSIPDVLRRNVDAPHPEGPTPPPEAWALVDGIGAQPTDLLVTKKQWGAFYGTGLDQFLHRKGIQTVLMTGIATNFGVESTARDAFDRGYELLFAEDAMSTLSSEAHAFATTAIFPRMGRVRKTEVLLSSLNG